MTRNPYFPNKVQSEQDLYEDLIIESIQIYGQDCYYLPRTIVNYDTILGDDIPSKFSSAYIVEMYIENIDGFSGEGNLFQKFGIEIRDQATFVVARKRWKEAVSDLDNVLTGDLPHTGDLIYFPLTKSLFQIMHVERESPFYQLSNLNVVKLECELFEYNDEVLDTGVDSIDAIETLGYNIAITLDSDSNSIPVVVGDILTQTFADSVQLSGEVIEWDSDRQIASLAHIGADDGKYHIFTVGGVLTSAQTAATRIIRGIDEDLGDTYNYQNDAFDSGTSFIDFTENNPFGDPS